MADEARFDPRGVLAALERNYVSYVLIGGLARVLRGTDEITEDIDICPSLRPESLRRLGIALDDLGAQRTDRRRLVVDEETLAAEPVVRLRTDLGELKLIAHPAGTRRGYDDLRRGASHEHLGQGLRPHVASVPDLARMAAALGRAHHLERSRDLRRIMELEVGMRRELGIER